jgi:hypothetical protein
LEREELPTALAEIHHLTQQLLLLPEAVEAQITTVLPGLVEQLQIRQGLSNLQEVMVQRVGEHTQVAVAVVLVLQELVVMLQPQPQVLMEQELLLMVGMAVLVLVEVAMEILA